jgi:putative ABC transport system ATP-binding protein
VSGSTEPRPARHPDDAMVACDGVVRIFRSAEVEVVALQGLDLRVARGDLMAIVGPSGSGKSTLLGILSGLDSPTAGTVRVAGIDLGAMSTRTRLAYRRRIVGFVWQQTDRNLLGYLTAAENVALPMQLAGRDRTTGRAGDAADRVAALLDLLGVSACRDRLPDQLSGGERQRVAIAVALANSPEVLLADEPTGELDSQSAEEVFAALRRVNDELGVTLLVVTHDESVSSQVRRTVSIRDGRTSTERLRHAGAPAGGTVPAEEFAVLDRFGRLQLPPEYTAALQLRDRVRLALEDDHVGVWPGQLSPPPDGSPDG